MLFIDFYLEYHCWIIRQLRSINLAILVSLLPWRTWYAAKINGAKI
jgi:hypothetical protein